MISIRRRAVAGGMLWAAVTITLGLAGLSSYMLDEAQERFIAQLSAKHTQVLVAVGTYSNNPEALAEAITDPAYQQPFSGQYWQVETAEGVVLTSASLMETLLPQPNVPAGEVSTFEFSGPNQERLLGISQRLNLEDGGSWLVNVASTIGTFEQEIEDLQRNLLLTFMIICTVGVVGALAQVTFVLWPLNTLREEVTRRWDTTEGMEVDAYPIEVAPLVEDINTLLQRNRDIVSRSRRQAADLAHAIKTPSAIMRNELATLQSKGGQVTEAINALDALDAQLKRSFARIRADSSQSQMPVATDGTAIIERMLRAFKALARNADRALTSEVAPGMRIRIDKSDLEEVLGNLLDNALKWAQSTVSLRTYEHNGQIVIQIEDDGPGIPQEDIARATESGQRLDTAKPGTGLGLAIATDLVQAYGGSLTLQKSGTLDGLSVLITLPAAPTKRSR